MPSSGAAAADDHHGPGADGPRGNHRVAVARRHADPAPSGTVLSSSINITNTILGAGMLAMPSAIAAVGLGLGIGLICLSATASGTGLFLLSRVAAQVGRKSSFFACAKITYPEAALWIDLAIAIKCFGVSVSYLVICGDLMPEVMQGLWGGALQSTDLLLSKQFWVTVSVIAIAPFSFLRRLDSLRYTSAFALMAVVYLVFVVLVFYVAPPESGMPFPRPEFAEIEWVKISSDLFTALPVFVFAFTCHQNIFSVYNELVDNSAANIEKVISGSILTSVGVYQTIAVIGYLTFGRNVTSNIIAMYPAGKLVTGGQFAIALLVLLSYPLQCHPARASLDKVLGQRAATTSASAGLPPPLAASGSSSSLLGPTGEIAAESDGEGDVRAEPGRIRGDDTPPSALSAPPPPSAARAAMSATRHTAITTTLLVLSYFVAVAVHNLSTILAFVGATGSTTIGYILPGLFYYRMRRNARPPGAPLEPLEFVAVSLALFGIFIMITSLTTQFLGGVAGGH
ncbi:hypothetical protein HK105_202654 [Polyrhizophydium stewartii]|uniref:Amino acid transporter transmembrane domain-containing protein n=1 Tax=Polyrhizophydium stewartii TaxID=2732419 RepID=A0ABR4NE43_9FUNG